MKVLLNENIPHDLRHFLPDFDVFAVAFMGWSSIESGDPLKVAAHNGFDVLITKDSGVPFQHNLAALPVAIIFVTARTNKLEDIRPFVPKILSALANLVPRTIARVE